MGERRGGEVGGGDKHLEPIEDAVLTLRPRQRPADSRQPLQPLGSGFKQRPAPYILSSLCPSPKLVVPTLVGKRGQLSSLPSQLGTPALALALETLTVLELTLHICSTGGSKRSGQVTCYRRTPEAVTWVSLLICGVLESCRTLWCTVH